MFDISEIFLTLGARIFFKNTELYLLGCWTFHSEFFTYKGEKQKLFRKSKVWFLVTKQKSFVRTVNTAKCILDLSKTS